MVCICGSYVDICTVCVYHGDMCGVYNVGGVCVCVCGQGNAYLWYMVHMSGSMRFRYQ